MTTRPINNNNNSNSSLNAVRTGSASSVTDAKRADRTDLGSQIGEATTPGGGFDVNLSQASKEKAQAYQKALEIARRTPDIREDRVAEIKKKIQDGNYQVDAGKIADGMLMEAIRDKVAEG